MAFDYYAADYPDERPFGKMMDREEKAITKTMIEMCVHPNMVEGKTFDEIAKVMVNLVAICYRVRDVLEIREDTIEFEDEIEWDEEDDSDATESF